MAIEVGQQLPGASFMLVGFDSEIDVRTSATGEIFAGKKVAVFGLPDASTPVCSQTHVADFVASASALESKAVDTVLAYL